MAGRFSLDGCLGPLWLTVCVHAVCDLFVWHLVRENEVNRLANIGGRLLEKLDDTVW